MQVAEWNEKLKKTLVYSAQFTFARAALVEKRFNACPSHLWSCWKRERENSSESIMQKQPKNQRWNVWNERKKLSFILLPFDENSGSRKDEANTVVWEAILMWKYHVSSRFIDSIKVFNVPRVHPKLFPSLSWCNAFIVTLFSNHPRCEFGMIITICKKTVKRKEMKKKVWMKV